MPYDDVDEAVDIANGTRFGLGASVFGPDQSYCLDVAKRLECGMVSINDFAVFYVSASVCLHARVLTPWFTGEVGCSRKVCWCISIEYTLFHSQDLPFGGTKASGYGRFGNVPVPVARLSLNLTIYLYRWSRRPSFAYQS